MIITMEEAKKLVLENKGLDWEDLIRIFEEENGEAADISEEADGIGVTFGEIGVYLGLNIAEDSLEDEDVLEELVDSAESGDWNSLQDHVVSHSVMIFDEDGTEENII